MPFPEGIQAQRAHLPWLLVPNYTEKEEAPTTRACHSAAQVRINDLAAPPEPMPLGFSDWLSLNFLGWWFSLSSFTAVGSSDLRLLQEDLPRMEPRGFDERTCSLQSGVAYLGLFTSFCFLLLKLQTFSPRVTFLVNSHPT